MLNLSEDIAEMFSLLEGCEIPSEKGGRWNGFGVINPGGGPGTKESKDKYRKTPRGMAVTAARKRRARSTMSEEKKDSERTRKAESKRRKRLETNLKLWKSSAQCICIGRELDPSEWERVMTEPADPAEVAACTDFMHFLKNCRRMSVEKIAKHLKVTEYVVTACLATRK
jgi:hypothetical protein